MAAPHSTATVRYALDVQWSETFYARRRGAGCPFCLEGRPDENRDGVRFYAGEVEEEPPDMAEEKLWEDVDALRAAIRSPHE